MATEEAVDEDGIPPAGDPGHRRYYKDGGLEMLLARDSAARTPCEAAWKIPAYRKMVATWLELVKRGHRMVLVVEMPQRDHAGKRERRDAVFVRVARIISGRRMVVAIDSVTGTVFCGRPLAPGE